MNWLREADQVETLAINGDSFVFEEIPENFRAFMNENAKDSKWVIQGVDSKNRTHLIDFVESLFYEPEAFSGCIFRPHHYVIGRKGSDSLVVQLCFECSEVRTIGTIEMEGYMYCEKLDEVASLFGIRPDRSSRDNRITYFPPPAPKPKQTWPIGGN